MKYLVMLLVALLAWWLLRGLFRNRVMDDTPNSDRTEAQPSTPLREASGQETMVACTYCQLHLPRSEAVWAGETPFCTTAHLRQHESERTGQ
jgi:uncharacterized protein